jgi:hypothetical protein
MTDLNELRARISLQALAEEAGAQFDASRTRTRSVCPLPNHAGDRSSRSFVVYENGMKWKCHSSCPSDQNGGDVISLYMAWKGVDFKTAVKELSERAGTTSAPVKKITPTLPKIYTPPIQWKRRAAQFIKYAEGNLASADAALEYLDQERGVSAETARAYHVGYNPQNLYDDAARWGLEGRKVWLPRGIVIPGLLHAEPHYIKIRRAVPGDVLGNYIGAWNEHDGVPDVKFGGPRGGKSVLFRLEFTDYFPVLLLTEGEWDTMILWEHCADLCDMGTIGGAQSKFDLLDLALLTRYPKIFVVHDDDKAGDKGRAYINSLKAISPRIESIAPPAHDLTDYWKPGGDLRKWVAGYVAAALKEINQSRWDKMLEIAQDNLCKEDG